MDAVLPLCGWRLFWASRWGWGDRGYEQCRM